MLFRKGDQLQRSALPILLAEVHVSNNGPIKRHNWRPERPQKEGLNAVTSPQRGGFAATRAPKVVGTMQTTQSRELVTFRHVPRNDEIAALTRLGAARVMKARSVPWARRRPDDVRSLTHADCSRVFRHFDCVSQFSCSVPHSRVLLSASKQPNLPPSKSSTGGAKGVPLRPIEGPDSTTREATNQLSEFDSKIFQSSSNRLLGKS